MRTSCGRGLTMSSSSISRSPGHLMWTAALIPPTIMPDQRCSWAASNGRMAKQPVITPLHEDFPRWYQDAVAKAELADNGPVRGTMVIRPYGFAIWELVQAELDRRIKDAGADNVYFPLLIPESFIRMEADNVAVFAP